jgi:D-glycero-D-manno-heptose 1,7-bisphosphate phosphatase
MTTLRKRAVFLDRDGVLNLAVVRDGKPYPPASVEEFTIAPDALDALGRLRSMKFNLFVVTNQPDVARGKQQRRVVESMNALLVNSLPLDGIYVCYHDDADGCDCRKPGAGLIRQAAAEHNLDLHQSYMVGDRWRDIDCGRAAGCISIFLDRGYAEQLRCPPHFRVASLTAVADVITSQETKERIAWASQQFPLQAEV